MDKQWLNSLSYPTALPIPPTTLLHSSHPIVYRTLNRLTRSALLSLALDWLSDFNQATTSPYLLQSPNTESYDLFPPASSLEQLREIYTGLEERKGTKREVLDRILEGDWRHGISLYALAMADFQFLYAHPTAQKWQAWQITSLSTDSSSPHLTDRAVPRFHPPTFLRNMHRECLPGVKMYFSFDRHAKLPLLILRVWIVESPYNTSYTLTRNVGQSFSENGVLYVAFPDFSPYLFISSINAVATPSISSTTKASDGRSLQKLVLETIPKALSRPGERYAIQNTRLSARSLEVLVELRGNGRTNRASGVWAMYAETKGDEATGDNPLNSVTFRSTRQDVDEVTTGDGSAADRRTSGTKSSDLKRKLRTDGCGVTSLLRDVAKRRFGKSALPNDRKEIDRLFVRIEDPFPIISLETAESDNQLPARIRGSSEATTGLERDNESFSENPLDDAESVGNRIWRPKVSVLFTGSHVFAGLRELVECGVIDGLRMPGWMTGENGISEGVIRNGRIRSITTSEGLL